ncbi:MAG: serine/threonine protein kinase [Candidatus Fervidibacter sp.]|uniref:serine/threonine protein kinase n=1 Tax=Candidatus Fervidibacter sp. TaxID=3100871 RepID=UPI00404A0899
MTQLATTQLCPNPKCGGDNPVDAIECPKCQTPQRQLLGRGTVLKGRYRIDGVCGCGGFGAVYLATDLQTQNSVAIKENHQHRTFARFEREAKLLMGLSHPNLPKVHEVFQDAGTGRAYLVMDYVSGETLEEFVRRTGALGWTKAKPIFAQIVDALTYLHSRNIVHRDIKPNNIIMAIRWEEVVVPPPSLNGKVIYSEIDNRRYTRGRRLWQQGCLIDLQRDGWLLSGVCQSGRVKRKNYRVSIELQPGRIGNRSCECAYFYGRRLCTHLNAPTDIPCLCLTNGYWEEVLCWWGGIVLNGCLAVEVLALFISPEI